MITRLTYIVITQGLNKIHYYGTAIIRKPSPNIIRFGLSMGMLLNYAVFTISQVLRKINIDIDIHFRMLSI